MDFIPEAEDEATREEVSHKLYRHIVNPSKKIWRDSTQTKTLTLPFHIGGYLIYTNEGHNYMVYLVGMNTNDPDIIKYSIKFLRVNIIILNEYFFKLRNVLYIGSITISSEDYINESKSITQEKLITLCFHKCYHLYNRNPSPVMKSYLKSIPNPCLY